MIKDVTPKDKLNEAKNEVERIKEIQKTVIREDLVFEANKDTISTI